MPIDGSTIRLSVEKLPKSQLVLQSREGGKVLGEADGEYFKGANEVRDKATREGRAYKRQLKTCHRVGSFSSKLHVE